MKGLEAFASGGQGKAVPLDPCNSFLTAGSKGEKNKTHVLKSFGRGGTEVTIAATGSPYGTMP